MVIQSPLSFTYKGNTLLLQFIDKYITLAIFFHNNVTQMCENRLGIFGSFRWKTQSQQPERRDSIFHFVYFVSSAIIN